MSLREERVGLPQSWMQWSAAKPGGGLGVRPDRQADHGQEFNRARDVSQIGQIDLTWDTARFVQLHALHAHVFAGSTSRMLGAGLWLLPAAGDDEVVRVGIEQSDADKLQLN